MTVNLRRSELSERDSHTPIIFSNTPSLTNLIVQVHVEDCAYANWRNANDEVLDPYAVSLEGDEEANLARNCLVEVALGKFEDRKEDDGDDPEDREENPVELVEKSKVWAFYFKSIQRLV